MGGARPDRAGRFFRRRQAVPQRRRRDDLDGVRLLAQYTFTLVAVDGRTLLAGTGSGLLRSTNGGRTWTVIHHLDGTTIGNVEVDPFDPGTIYLGTNGEGVLVSRDGGATWHPANAGLARQGRREIHDLTFNPAVPGRIYALPLEGGLYKAEF